MLEFRAKLQGKTVARSYCDAEGELRPVERKLAPRTVNLTMALVRSILRFAVASGHIPVSPLARLGRGKLMLPVEKTKLGAPIQHAEDVGRLLGTIRVMGEELRLPGLHPLFALLVYTGLRRGDWPSMGRCRPRPANDRGAPQLRRTDKEQQAPVGADPRGGGGYPQGLLFPRELIAESGGYRGPGW